MEDIPKRLSILHYGRQHLTGGAGMVWDPAMGKRLIAQIG
jgi:hypothetical protein